MSLHPDTLDLTFPLADITLRGSLVTILMKPGMKITFEEIKSMYHEVNVALNGKKVVVMLDTRKTSLLDYPESVLRYASNNEHSHKELAYAILIDGVGPKMLASFYMKLHGPKTPTRIFNDEAEAKEWVTGMLITHS